MVLERGNPRGSAFISLEVLARLLEIADPGANLEAWQTAAERELLAPSRLEAPIRPAKELREIRAIELLEYFAAPGADADATRLAAIGLLNKLAAGAPDARLTREAKASRERLERRADM